MTPGQELRARIAMYPTFTTEELQADFCRLWPMRNFTPRERQVLESLRSRFGVFSTDYQARCDVYCMRADMTYRQIRKILEILKARR